MARGEGVGEARKTEEKIRIRAGLVSLVVGAAILGAKWFAFRLTSSSAILSDALESIVNVVAAAFALGGLVWGGRPADRSHPYGHGKIEYLSAAFEGGLITFAAGAILYCSSLAWIEGDPLSHVDDGLLISIGAGVMNAVLGVYLKTTGRRTRSLALVADGEHVLSDFWTSVGVVTGLVLVKVTGIRALDHVAAIVMALWLARTGVRVVGRAVSGLLDAEDATLLKRVVAGIEAERLPGLIGIHRLRAIHDGRFVHVDAHYVVPEFWAVEHAHDVMHGLSNRALSRARLEGEIDFHLDPCRRMLCATCDLGECPVRQEEFAGREPISLDEAAMPLPEESPLPKADPTLAAE